MKGDLFLLTLRAPALESRYPRQLVVYLIVSDRSVAINLYGASPALLLDFFTVFTGLQ